ncbi:hypothetical protein QR680_001894 [Steinernema hermaphroditum]|uniref:ENTH domain-containing protein n=1 Tax=Steinernema hermaphroditum TaxID=289476 RepID=A0AA39LH44_9BILA|nr:hypothetical protein QR680_001894 [Steinernema hermaphroditum]
MSISTIRRQVKNVAYNFSDAQVKVREATSNDPWGPTTALMSEIADLTHNPMSFTEIMSMLWKRLNDHGKNWRHVYKSLVLLDYLIKCGSEKVAQQCRENIYSIETLKDFQHIEDNRDQGMNVREKAKQMVSLLYDEERLKNERARFQLTRKRFIQNGSGISSDGKVRTVRKSETGADLSSEFEDARPSSAGEEEMQLQIAMALSKEECEKEEEMRKGDAVRLQLALEESRREMNRTTSLDSAPIAGATLSQSAIDDLLSLGVGIPVTEPVVPANSNPWGGPVADPWSPAPNSTSVTSTSPIYPNLTNTSSSLDPWAPAPAAASAPASDSTSLLSSTAATSSATNDPWESLTGSSSTSAVLVPTPVSASSNAEALKQRKTPESFLGENSALVNLDNLMGATTIQPKPASNPFMLGSNTSTTASTNPFAATQRPSPTLNEMRAQRGPDGLPLPLQPQPANNGSASTTNPFISF